MKKIKKYFLTFGASISTFAVPVLAMSCKNKEDSELDQLKKDLDSLIDKLGPSGLDFKNQVNTLWKNSSKMSKKEKEKLIEIFKTAKENLEKGSSHWN
ncbi:variable surface lipoprotein [Mycoplasmopsis lipofaciens]|uniref:variable surface lipoprotein n=1 Tax=Mycoplasmopsis lipofaciens TaxID=114884 RepID=UPI000488C2E2|nr:variable surface lipoprotein [Mycoplasmopsis lipofaciens]